MVKLPADFYQSHDVWQIARSLLGKKLCTHINGEFTSGIIVETEAYHGVEDKACHAYGGRFTERTKTMYLDGGVAYVYLCYGIHHLINVVTATAGQPHAVLIRALEPKEGIETMLARREMAKLEPRITAGPGALSKAMGIDRLLNGVDFGSNEIWIEDNGTHVEDGQIVSSPRVGVAYAADHALLPWRYYIKGNKFVSKPNKG